MLKIISDARRIGALYRRRVTALSAALRRGLQKYAAEVDARQVDNLSGSNADPPGAYPVPRRTGHLAQSHFFRVTGSQYAIVANSAKYAIKIHEDRPFLEDAAEATDGGHIMATELRRTVFGL